jgi:AcrR family transcriptional regulator
MRNPLTVDIAALLKTDLANLETFGPKERILVTALRLFVNQGYFNTNVPDLSRESRCSVGSIYHHFKNKEEVAAALYRAGISSFREALSQVLKPEQDISDILQTIVRFFLEFTERNVELSKYLWLSRHHEFMTAEFLAGTIRHPTMVGFDSLGRTLTSAIKHGIRSGKIRPLHANVLWSVLFGVPLSYARDWLDGYNTEPPSAVAQAIAESCWRALKV